MRLKDLLLILAAVAFVALLARFTISLPFPDFVVPITGQSLAVLLAAYALGSTRGTLAMILYLLLGGAGLPIFANGASGWPILAKDTAGFLFGFVLAAMLMGYFREQLWGKTFGWAFGAMIWGTLLILVAGLCYLFFLRGFSWDLLSYFYPIFLGALIKAFVGAILLVFGHQQEIWEKM